MPVMARSGNSEEPAAKAPPVEVVYFPAVFDADTVDRAKSVILTQEGPEATTERRWAVETPYVAELIGQAVTLGRDVMLLDYGCGIGRLAKLLIETHGCFVIGVDISASMRSMAVDYVASDRFIALSPEQLDTLAAGGLRFDAAICVWVLQHCLNPDEDVARIHRAMAPGGAVFVLNMPKRAVPAIRSSGADEQFIWAHDGIDVAAQLTSAFLLVADGSPEPDRAPNMADAGAYWLSLRRE